MVRVPLVTLLAFLIAGCSQSSSQRSTSPADTSSPSATTSGPAVDVVELTATAAIARMESGELTSHALTQAYLSRIAAIDADGPKLGAVIETNPNALAEADALDRERAAGKVRGRLHGLPVLVKDNIDVAGLVNSAGSLAMAEHRPRSAAFLVMRLRAAGAVILGKTNLSEWANFRSTRGTSGWSSRGGQTKNPYALDRSPCGSSSGSAVAAAASLAAVTVGTETDGSIICPAAVNGVVGLKPTVGLVSRSGIIPISVTQDTAGPMGRTVTDTALLLSALAGVDPADPAGARAEGHVAPDYLAHLTTDAWKGKRFGMLRDTMGYHPEVDAAADRTADLMIAAGAQVIDVAMKNYAQWDPPELDVLLYEFKDGLNRYLRSSGAPQASLAALIAWNRANRPAVMPFFGQELFERAEQKGPLTDAAYLKALRTSQRAAGPEGLNATLAQYKLDALIAPSVSPAWPIDHVLGDHFVGAGYGLAAVAGTPSLTVPIGNLRGLPIGLTFVGPAWSEAELLGYGFALESLLKARTPPDFRPTVTD